MTFHDYHGAIHVHSVHSDGSGSIPDIIQAAGEAGLDFLVLTEHAGLRRHHAEWEGRHGDLLVMVGAEVGSRRLRHYLVMGVHDPAGLKEMSLEEGLRHVRAEGGLSFVAHPRGTRVVGLRLRPWTAWDRPHYNGIEVWSWMHDWMEDFRWRRLREFYTDPFGQITGPHPEILAAWDRVAAVRRVTGIAGLDAHAKPLLWRWFKFFPYEMLFGTTLTHVLTEPFTGDAAADAGRVMEALAQGRCYMGYHVLGDPTGFRFRARTRLGEVEMGGEASLDEEATLSVDLPSPAEITLVGPGESAGAVSGRQAEFRPAVRGAFRVEVRQSSQPWIFSNHIHVT